jgi:hypothetical protein
MGVREDKQKARNTLLGIPDIVMLNGEKTEKYIAMRDTGDNLRIKDRHTGEELFSGEMGTICKRVGEWEPVTYNIIQPGYNIHIIGISTSIKTDDTVRITEIYHDEEVEAVKNSYCTLGLSEQISDILETRILNEDRPALYDCIYLCYESKTHEVAQFYVEDDVLLVDIIYSKSKDIPVVRRLAIDTNKGKTVKKSNYFPYDEGAMEVLNILWSKGHIVFLSNLEEHGDRYEEIEDMLYPNGRDEEDYEEDEPELLYFVADVQILDWNLNVVRSGKARIELKDIDGLLMTSINKHIYSPKLYFQSELGEWQEFR